MKKARKRTLSRRRRFEVLEKHGYRCTYCGRGPEDGVVLQVDHAKPFARGGEDDDENLVASCVDCNYGKWDRIVALPARTFLGWLRVQKTRDDPVGDLARDEEIHKFIEPASFKHLARQVRREIRPLRAWWVIDGSPMWAAWHAWREYRRGGKPTIAVEKLRAVNEKDKLSVDRETTCIWNRGVPGGIEEK